MDQLLAEASSASFVATDQIRELFREASLVSLWFFLKIVCGYSGPFEKLNGDLHVEMCNFRQALLEPGCRGIILVPRGFYKSTIITEGGTAWELIRDPDLSIRITNAIASKAEGFMHTVERVFDANDFFAWLFPEHVPAKNAMRWNNLEMVLPSRTRYKREASVETGGTEGASEGRHYDLHVVDDMVGFAALDTGQASSADMYRTSNWFKTSEKSLLVSPRTSRVVVVGTRYAVDDVYYDILRDTYELEGIEPTDFVRSPKGRWRAYNRKAVEDGVSTFPENWTIEDFSRMAEDDWWTYVTQYLNDPVDAGVSELVTYDVPMFEMTYDDDKGWLLFDGGVKEIPLSTCDVVQGVDPAGSERRESARTSRSAVVVVATSPDRKRFVLDIKVGYVEITQVFNWMFTNKEKWGANMRATFLEALGGFKVLRPLLRNEETKREEKGERFPYLGLRSATTVGDKDARIRTNLQPILNANLLRVEGHYKQLLMEELRGFPQTRKKDILEALVFALIGSVVPLSQEQQDDVYWKRDRQKVRSLNVAGY